MHTPSGQQGRKALLWPTMPSEEADAKRKKRQKEKKKGGEQARRNEADGGQQQAKENKKQPAQQVPWHRQGMAQVSAHFPYPMSEFACNLHLLISHSLLTRLLFVPPLHNTPHHTIPPPHHTTHHTTPSPAEHLAYRKEKRRKGKQGERVVDHYGRNDNKPGQDK